MTKLFRYFIVALIFAGGFAIMNYVQHRYDVSDLRKAIEVVQAAKPGGATATGALLSERYKVPASAIRWDSELESKWRGTVLVTAQINGVSEPLSWQVDLSRQHVMPISEAAKALK